MFAVAFLFGFLGRRLFGSLVFVRGRFVGDTFFETLSCFFFYVFDIGLEEGGVEGGGDRNK